MLRNQTVSLLLTILYSNAYSCLVYKIREWYFRMKRSFGYSINLNDSFVDDLESGLSSHNFDIISQNEEDSRSGLDELAKAEISKIMREDHLNFDKARLLYIERKFHQHGIAADGTPTDPRAVMFN